MRLIDKMAVGFVIAFLIGVAWLASEIWTLGSDESDYEIICLGGHEYWRANFMQKGFLSIRLDDEGRPVNCKGK